MQAGIPYFPLDTVTDDKLRLIEAEFGLTGFGIAVRLWQKIYSQSGYYLEWNDEVALLFAREVGVGGSVVSEIVSALIRRGIFDKTLYEKYGVLTSSEVQRRYFEAVKRRKSVEVKKDLLLLNVTVLGENVNIIEKNVCKNEKNVCNLQQRKERKEKERKYITVVSRLNEKAGTKYRADSKLTTKWIDRRFEDGFTADDLCTVIDKKCKQWKGTEMQKYLRPETLFGSKFESYLNEPETITSNTGKRFDDREYTREELDAKIRDPLKEILEEMEHE